MSKKESEEIDGDIIPVPLFQRLFYTFYAIFKQWSQYGIEADTGTWRVKQ